MGRPARKPLLPLCKADGYDGRMTVEAALQAAEKLARSFGVTLGRCLLSDPLRDKTSWGFSFDIVDGPKDWSWTVVVTADASKSAMLAVHCRPHPDLQPRIKRRWWLFGERLEKLPLYRRSEFSELTGPLPKTPQT